MKIRDVKAGMENVVLIAKVVSVSEPRRVQTRYGSALVANAVLEDDTGRIVLNLWRWQIKLVKPGDIVRIEGAFATSYRGRVELNVGSRGRITVIKRSG